MARALELARAGIGLASPNPHVGALILDAHENVVGQGTHTYDGLKHAEVIALAQAGDRARGGTLYLNLEPCSHQGRTGPCADAVIAAGVQRVVAAMQDPNPAVSGRGFEKLRAAGIEVTVGVCEREARKLNEAFAKWIRTGLPFVTLKAAASREGFIAPADRTRVAITGEQAIAHVQETRHAHDAILVGVGTVLADDPLLTDRSGKPRRRPLMRVVLDSRLRMPVASQLVTSAADDLIVFCSDGADHIGHGNGDSNQGDKEQRAGDRNQNSTSSRRTELERHGVRVVAVPESHGFVDVNAVLEYLGSEKILSVLIEGGAEINRGVLNNDLADKVLLYESPRTLGAGIHWTGGAPFDRTRAVQWNRYHLGDDVATEMYLHSVYG